MQNICEYFLKKLTFCAKTSFFLVLRLNALLIYVRFSPFALRPSPSLFILVAYLRQLFCSLPRDVISRLFRSLPRDAIPLFIRFFHGSMRPKARYYRVVTSLLACY